MKKILKSILVIILLVAMVSSFPIQVSAAENEDSYEPVRLPITARAAIVIDFESGDVLYELNADEMLAPASMTKMMTLYLVYEAMENGQFDLDTKITVSQRAVNLSRDGFNTNVPLSLGVEYSVAELIDAAVVVSAGGATLALAELVAGSVDNFLELMNNRIEEWGADALFFSTIGGTTHTRMTARTMGVITRNFIMRFPEILEVTAKRTISFAGRSSPTTNRLLDDYEGLDGFKTGTSMESLECFAGTAERDGVRIITVVMGSNWNHRFRDTRILLDYGFEQMQIRQANAIEYIIIEGSRRRSALWEIRLSLS